MGSSDLTLAQTFCPVLYFDSRERYFPIDWNQWSLTKTASKTPTLNAYVRVLSPSVTWVYFFLYYLHDDGLGTFHIDSHAIDVEMVVLEINTLTAGGSPKLNRVSYHPHGTAEHFWLNPQDTANLVASNTERRVPVYCSRGKHATYPIKGTIWRYMGFANDTNDTVIKVTNGAQSLTLLTDVTLASSSFAPKKWVLTSKLPYPTVPLDTVRYRLLWQTPPSVSFGR